MPGVINMCTVINMSTEEVQTEVEAALGTAEGDLSHRCLLFKVPAAQRRANPQAFEPQLFFFGPYQYAALASNSARAAVAVDGEHLKRQVAEALLEEGQFQELARKIERHYANNFTTFYPQMTSQDWGRSSMKQHAERMAVDAVTVVATEYLTSVIEKASFGLLVDHNIAAFSNPMIYMLMRDALLVENQIPLNVLGYAFEHAFESSENPSFKNVVKPYFSMVKNIFPDHRQNQRNSSGCLLGAIYDSLTPSQDDEDPQVQRQEYNDSKHDFRLRTASQLARCGIQCRVIKEGKVPELPAHGATFMSAISFNKKEKVIELPRICVGDDTMHLLHNLLAYEASCRFPKGRFVVSYCDFMDGLIDNEEDVQLLVKAGVICNALGSHEELATAWNKLCKCVMTTSTLKDYKIILQVENLAKRRWRGWRADFKETYWEKKPWLMVSIVAATVLLVLTFLQTIFTMNGAK